MPHAWSSASVALPQWPSAGGGDPPDRVRHVVGDDQRAARIDRDPDRPSPRLAVAVQEAGHDIDRLAGRLAVAERHEDHAVADRLVAVPAAMLADEGARGE